MYNKFAMNLSKFKKIGGDKEHTIMEHEDGHTMKIAHKALSPKMRAEISKLESHEPKKMAKGGEVKKPKLEIEEIRDDRRPASKKLDIEHIGPRSQVEEIKMADGGEVGDEIPYDQLLPQEAAQSAPFMMPTDSPMQSRQPSMAPAMDATPEPAPSLAAPTAPVPNASAAMAPQTQLAPQMGQAEEPSTLGGYEKQVGGVQQEASAEGQKAREAAAAVKGTITEVSKLATDYQTHYNELDSERKAFIDDITNKHIEPQRYLGSMDTGRRFDTAVGLILGGFAGGGSGHNSALDFLNKQIDRDIDAQKADIDKKQTLLSANLRQFGNLRDATDMTKVMMNDILVDKLRLAEANAASPIAKAKAQQQIGQLEQSIAPLVQQLATRRMLQGQDSIGGAPGSSLNKADPTNFVPSVVPKEHQEAVYKEIERAQNTRGVAKTAVENFDAVAKAMKSAGGLGRLGVAAYSPAQLQALEAELGSTVGDMEGTVREAAMHNVKNAYLPRATDTAERLDKRREELNNYLKLKSAAPRAKSYGLDLDKFQSTSRSAEAQLDPQQQTFLKWARENPSDPRSSLILKKLGIK